ncbi:MAG: DsrE/DsrF/DrsH-like family protein [Pseudomonadota bacterium]
MSRKRLALLITRATPESAYVPLMMAATAAAMDYECKLFFAFGGLELLRPAPVLEVPASPEGRNPGMDSATAPSGAALGRPASPEGRNPGMDSAALPDLAELRAACLEQGVEMIACSASLSMCSLTREQLVPEATVAGMATWLVFASGAEIQLNFG